MPIRRRLELLKWADRGERYIIEDDYDSEFRYKGKPIPALQGYDIHERVIYLGTFSRSIAPALRMSYMVLPESLLCVYEREYRFINSTVSKIDQKIVERFLAEGYYERHLNRMRALYKSRHDTLLNALKPLLSIGSVSGEYAGVSLCFSRFTMGEAKKMPSKKRSRVKYGFMDCRHLRRRRCREVVRSSLDSQTYRKKKSGQGQRFWQKNYWNDKKGEAYCGSLLLSIGKGK